MRERNGEELGKKREQGTKDMNRQPRGTSKGENNRASRYGAALTPRILSRDVLAQTGPKRTNLRVLKR